MKTHIDGFLLNSIPKSGTHLLHRILQTFPNITSKYERKYRFDYYIDRVLSPDCADCHELEWLRNIGNNQFYYGHCDYSHELLELGVKIIFLYRDPRDILVSNLDHIIKFDTIPGPIITPKLTKEILLNQYSTYQERLMAILEHPCFYTLNRRKYEWLPRKQLSNVFYISYEEIVGLNSRQSTIRNLYKFLYGYDAPYIVNYKIPPQDCPTFNVGKIGRWKETFNSDLKRRFKEKYNFLLIMGGYETGDTW